MFILKEGCYAKLNPVGVSIEILYRMRGGSNALADHDISPVCYVCRDPGSQGLEAQNSVGDPLVVEMVLRPTLSTAEFYEGRTIWYTRSIGILLEHFGPNVGTFIRVYNFGYGELTIRNV